MKRFAAGAAALWLSHAALAASTASNDWKRSGLYVTGVADIDAQGKIEHVDLLPMEDKGSEGLAAKLAPLAKATMARWAFVPVTDNGKPAAAHTFLHGVFELRPQGSNYEARLVFLGNGPELDRRQEPRYPIEMASTRVQAIVNMLALVQPDGSLSDVHLESAQSTGQRPVAAFVRAAKEAMRSWHAEPETVDGHGVKTWIRVPIAFNLVDMNGLPYAAEFRRAVDSPADPVQSTSDNQTVALDSPVKKRPESP